MECGITKEQHQTYLGVQRRLPEGGGTCPEPDGKGVVKTYAKVWRGERLFQ